MHSVRSSQTLSTSSDVIRKERNAASSLIALEILSLYAIVQKAERFERF